MRLVRYGERGHEKPGVFDAQGQLRDLSGIVRDIDATVLDPAGLSGLSALDMTTLPMVPGAPRLGAPVARVGKFICVGLNYHDHAAESGMAPPEQPILFMKAASAVCGPNDGILIPPGSEKTDWEVELGVVIGSTARRVSEQDAMNHVAGYVLVNDLSERAYQLEHGGQWVKGKSCDDFGPIGPWLATRDEIPDPQALRLTLSVNDEVMQDGSTSEMIFGVAFLVSYISRYMTLEPGDVISTGTPAGVGLGLKPPRYLKAGDVVELSIEGLGSQRQIARQAI